MKLNYLLRFPSDPAAVVLAGASETVNNAEDDLTALPSLFSTLTKYVPSTGKVNLATIDVEELKASSALIIPPVEFIASTVTDTKFVPAIVTDVCVFSITVGLMLEIVGLVSPTVTEPPRLTAEPFIVIDSFAILALVTASSSICVIHYLFLIQNLLNLLLLS